nr:putative ribonuclease H-like domain-containing protein [Tanacetum cinerariifolium]
SGPTWLFDIDTFTQSMNYQPVAAGNQPNSSAGIQGNFDAGKVGKESVSTQQYVLLPLWFTGSHNPQNTDADAAFDDKENESKVHVSPSSSDKPKKHDEKTKREAKGKNPSQYPDDPNMPALEEIVYLDKEEDVGAEADFSNLETTPQIRSMTRMVKEQGGMTQINDEDFHAFMFACFLSQEEPKRVHQALKDPNLPKGKRAIGSKWVFRNKNDERGIVIRNKARLVAHGHTQEEGIDYEEVFAPVAKIEANRLVLAYASFMGFMVYQMDVKSTFLYGTIKEKVYVCQPLGFEDPDYPDKVYKVVKALYGLHQAPKAWYETLANYLLENGFQRGKIDQTLFIKKQKDGKSTSTPIDTKKPLLKDPNDQILCLQFVHVPVSKASVSIKKSNDVMKLQAIIDKKKMIITEDSIRQSLRLDDADGIDCLPNEEIFSELAQMGYEKPSTKLTFYKAFFSAQ